jgi:hypothetical protein
LRRGLSKRVLVYLKENHYDEGDKTMENDRWLTFLYLGGITGFFCASLLVSYGVIKLVNWLWPYTKDKQ